MSAHEIFSIIIAILMTGMLIYSIRISTYREEDVCEK